MRCASSICRDALPSSNTRCFKDGWTTPDDLRLREFPWPGLGTFLIGTTHLSHYSRRINTPGVFMAESASLFATPQPRNVDWDLARLTRANVLMVGSDAKISDLIFAIWSMLDAPIRVRRADERLALG